MRVNASANTTGGIERAFCIGHTAWFSPRQHISAVLIDVGEFVLLIPLYVQRRRTFGQCKQTEKTPQRWSVHRHFETERVCVTFYGETEDNWLISAFQVWLYNAIATSLPNTVCWDDRFLCVSRWNNKLLAGEFSPKQKQKQIQKQATEKNKNSAG